MTSLLDANVLIAFLTPDHVHHGRVHAEIGEDALLATCPTTQGSFVRFALRTGASPADALASLGSLMALQRHRSLPDDLAFGAFSLVGVVGHRQVTDAYLASLARHHQVRLLTLDEGLAALHDDVADLVESV